MRYTLRRKPGLAMMTGVALWIGLLLSFTSTFAQTVTGGLRGAVTDTNGAVIPGAVVTARNVDTGVEYKTAATGEGIYVVPRIPSGRYRITIEAPSFKKAEVTEVEVSIGKDAVVDVKLELGTVSEVVTVVGGSEALVEKDTVQISTTFQARKVQDLPINTAGGGLDRVALYVPGVTVGFGNINSNGTTISANGQRARSNNFNIDGVDNNDIAIGGPSYFVQNADLVQEYQVVTNNFSAEYGRNQGAIVNIVSKSGTNQYHGTGAWYHRDRKLWDSLTNLERRRVTATSPDSAKNPAPELNNVFSYTFGGPVIKEKLFFFVGGQFIRNPQNLIFEPASLAPTPDGVRALLAAFPNNPAVQYYANYSAFSAPLGNPQIRADVPQSTITIGTATIPVAAPRRVVKALNNWEEYNFRGDWVASEKDRVYGRYFFQKRPGQDQLAGASGFTGDNLLKSRLVGGSWTRNLSTRVVNEFRVNYSKFFTLFGGGSGGGKAQIPGVEDIDKALAQLVPQFTAANGAPLLSVGPATNLPQGREITTYEFTDNLSVAAGNHQIKAGLDFRRVTQDAPFLPNVNGSFVFSTAQRLADNNPNGLTVGLGPTNVRFIEYDQFYYFQDDWRIRQNLTLNLGVRYERANQPVNTLNEINAVREANPAEAFWRQTLPLSERIPPTIKADNNNFAPRLGFVYTPRWGKRIFGEDKTVISGGFGVAYDLSFNNILYNISTASPTVFLTTAVLPVPDAVPTGDKVRGAAVRANAIAFNTFDPRWFARTTINPDYRSPYSLQWSLRAQRELFRGNVVEVRYVATKSNGQFQTVNKNPFIGNLVNGFSQTYFDEASGTVKSLDFPKFGNKLPADATPLVIANDPATPDNEAVGNGRIYPYGAARERINGAQSIYHGLQARYDARLKSQWTFGVNYAWGHAIDNQSEVFSFAGGNSIPVSQNPLDISRGDRGNSGFDVRHTFSAYWIWDLPFFTSQKGFLGRALGGWQLNGGVRVQSGRPFTPTQLSTARNPYEDNLFMANFGGNASHFRPFAGNPNAPLTSVAITDVDACLFYARCNVTAGGAPIPAASRGGVNVLRPSSTGFYSLNDLNRGVFTPVSQNDARFIVNGPGAAQRFGTPFGSVGRNSFVGDRLENVDLSLFKTTRVTERVALQYRLELYNAFNHPFFGVPNSLNVDNAGTTFFNYQENSGGRRVIQMGLRVTF